MYGENSHFILIQLQECQVQWHSLSSKTLLVLRDSVIRL
jgi:hypothetical protein